MDEMLSTSDSKDLSCAGGRVEKAAEKTREAGKEAQKEANK